MTNTIWIEDTVLEGGVPNEIWWLMHSNITFNATNTIKPGSISYRMLREYTIPHITDYIAYTSKWN